MHSLNVYFYDARSNQPIEEGDKLRNGKLVLNKVEDAAYIQVLLRTDYINIDKTRYKVRSLSFSIDESALYVYLEESYGR
ncbi:MAG: hypothetical protein HPY50_21140 [Firmicutes bacterium]|nr:hypothetical protein [Bacillota bacterium]